MQTQWISGSGSVVEHLLAKEKVTGSIPVSRSIPTHPVTHLHTYTYVATSPSGKARLCKSCISGSNPLVASQSDVILFVGHVFFFCLVIGRPHATAT